MEEFIKKCPICGSNLIQAEQKTYEFSTILPFAQYRCPNPKCIYVLNAFYNSYENLDTVNWNDNIEEAKKFYCEQSYPQLGWECLKCGAVMAPSEKVCVNCRGNITIT